MKLLRLSYMVYEDDYLINNEMHETMVKEKAKINEEKIYISATKLNRKKNRRSTLVSAVPRVKYCPFMYGR